MGTVLGIIIAIVGFPFWLVATIVTLPFRYVMEMIEVLSK